MYQTCCDKIAERNIYYRVYNKVNETELISSHRKEAEKYFKEVILHKTGKDWRFIKVSSCGYCNITFTEVLDGEFIGYEFLQGRYCQEAKGEQGNFRERVDYMKFKGEML